MGIIAQFERPLIRGRQREVIAATKAKGKQVGAKRKLTGVQILEIRQCIAGGEFKSQLAEEYGASRQALYASRRVAAGN